MKAFALLLTVAFASYLADVESRMTMDQIANAMKTLKKSCLAKTGVSEEILAATANGEYAEDRSLMCFYYCVMKMMQVIGKDGKINIAAVMRQADTMLPENIVDKFKAAATICTEKVPPVEDQCELAWHYVKCNWETDKEVYMFPS